MIDVSIARRNYYSIIILKPDIINMALQKKLKMVILKNNLKIKTTSLIIVDLNFIKEFYQWDSIIFSKELNEYLCAKILPIWFIEGENAIDKILNIKNAFRKKYSIDQMHNLIHCPDSHDDFERELKLILNKIKFYKMRTPNQVEVIIYKKEDNRIYFLILKRSAQKGGFWQPITGGVEEDETYQEAVLREIYEEIGVVDIVDLIDINYTFEFLENNINYLERVFGAKISPESHINISKEHTEYKWVDGQTAIKNFLKYPGNITGFKKLIKILKQKEGLKS